MKRSAVTVVKISFVRMGSAFQHVRSLPQIQEAAAVLGRYRSQVFLVALSVIACQVPLPYIASAVAGLGKNGSNSCGLRRDGNSVFLDAVLAWILSGEDAGAGRSADGLVTKRRTEQHSLARHRVEVRSEVHRV